MSGAAVSWPALLGLAGVLRLLCFCDALMATPAAEAQRVAAPGSQAMCHQQAPVHPSDAGWVATRDDCCCASEWVLSLPSQGALTPKPGLTPAATIPAIGSIQVAVLAPLHSPRPQLAATSPPASAPLRL